MKKLMWVVIAILVSAVIITIYTNKTTTAGEKTTIREIEKSPGETVTTKTTIDEKTPGSVKVQETTKFAPGADKGKAYLKECEVKFHKFDDDGMHVYVTKDEQLYRMKYRTDAKENMLKAKKGDTLRIWSTYPLDAKEFAQYNQIERCELKK